MEKYKFHSAEPAISVDIYLPKKPEFQGTLYNTLTEGFQFDKLKAHFESPLTRVKLNRFFGSNSIAITYAHKNVISKLENIFTGYSMSEVDGAYWSSDQNVTISETTQVIRIIFRPDYEIIYNPKKFTSEELVVIQKEMREFLKTVSLSKETLLEQSDKTNEFENWVKAVMLFVYGYLLLNICDKIDTEYEKEEEIWSVSFIHTDVNRIVLYGGYFDSFNRLVYYRYEKIRIGEKFDIGFKKFEHLEIRNTNLPSILLNKKNFSFNRHDKISSFYDQDMKLSITEKLAENESICVEVPPGYRLVDIKTELKTKFTLACYSFGLKYWFSILEAGTFKLTGQLISDNDPGGYYYKQMIDNPTDWRLSRYLAEQSMARTD